MTKNYFKVLNEEEAAPEVSQENTEQAFDLDSAKTTASDWTEKFKEADTLEKENEVLYEFFKTEYPNIDFEKEIKPIINVLVREAREKGLGRSVLPQLDFLANYHNKNGGKPLKNDNYSKLHNLFADYALSDYLTEDVLRSGGADNLDCIIFNPSFYKYDEETMKYIIEWYYRLSNVSKLAVKPGKEIVRFNNKTIDLRRANSQESKELRDAIIYKPDGTVNTKTGIEEKLKAFIDENKLNDSKTSAAYEQFKKILKENGYDVEVKTDVDKIIAALLITFKTDNTDPTAYKDIISKAYGTQQQLDNVIATEKELGQKDHIEHLKTIYAKYPEIVNDNTYKGFITKMLSNKKEASKTTNNNNGGNGNATAKRDAMVAAEAFINNFWPSEYAKEHKENPRFWAYLQEAIAKRYKLDTKDQEWYSQHVERNLPTGNQYNVNLFNKYLNYIKNKEGFFHEFTSRFKLSAVKALIDMLAQKGERS